MKLFDNLDFRILNDKNFKEDSVREEIILPIIKQLGYSTTGVNKIVRSKNLPHPFVYIGTVPRKINIIPDYICEINGKPIFILDAKSPQENIVTGKNVEQAFCYAIHPEIRTQYYALCNGREITIFNINKFEPILHLKIEEVEEKWGEINKILSPTALTKPHLLNFRPDFGLWLLKSGWRDFSEFHFVGAWANFVGKIEDELYSFFSVVTFGEEKFAASFDFSRDQLDEFLQAVPPNRKLDIEQGLKRQPYMIDFDPNTTFEIIVHAKMGNAVITNEDESYMPLKVVKFEQAPWHELSSLVTKLQYSNKGNLD